MNIAFFKPFIDENEFELTGQTLRDDAVYMVSRLEDEISSYYGVKHAISTNNGTAAKHLALSAMDIKRGDKILCSVNSFVSVPEVVRYFDAEPIFVDVSPLDFNIDPHALEKAIKANHSKKLKAVIISHIAGQSAQMSELRAVAKKYEIKIINDSALGVRYNGKLIGSDDDFISCFQMQHQSRFSIASTGIILTNDDKIASRAKLLRSHAIEQNSFDELGNLDYIYDIKHIGQRYDLNSLCAAFSLAQFRKLDRFITEHKKVAAMYDKLLASVPHISCPKKLRDHIYTQYIIKIDKNRDGFAKKMIANGIKVGLHYIPLHLLSYYRKKYNYRITDFPSALGAYSQVLSLPIYPALKESEIEYICKCIVRIASTRE